MTGRKALLALAVVLVAAAITAPAASARTDQSYFSGGSLSKQGPPPTAVRVVEVPSDSGFQWGDAAIGAGAALAVALVGLGATLAMISLRSRHAVAYHRATPSAS